MDTNMVDITMHIDEKLDSRARETLRDIFLETHGVMAADCPDKTPHLMILEYDPDAIDAGQLITIAKQNGLHAELIGM
jgi:hypothetical protein